MEEEGRSDKGEYTGHNQAKDQVHINALPDVFQGFYAPVLALSNVFQEFCAARRPTASRNLL
jgi:hypothetical protein